MEVHALLITAGVLGAGTIALIPSLAAAARVYPYAYPNATIRALRAKLLKKEDFERLLELPYSECILALEKKHYTDLSKTLSNDISYAQVEAALESSVVQTLGKIKRISPTSSRAFITVLLEQYDIAMIKAIIRSNVLTLRSQLDMLHVSSLFSSQFISKEEISLDELYNELKLTPYAAVIKKHLAQLRAGSFVSFEQELDLLYYQRLLARAQNSYAKSYTKKLIDWRNLSLTVEGSDFFIPGGKVQVADLQAAVKSSRSLASRVEDLYKLYQKHAYVLDKKRFATAIERAFEHHLVSYAQNLFSKEPLSDAPIIGFVLVVKSIARNVNALLKLKYHKYDAKDIKEVLLL